MVSVQIAEGKTAFCGGEEIAGVVVWELGEGVEAVEVRLVWGTRGKGQVDEEVAERVRFERPGGKGEGRFAFRSPGSPVSFIGKIVSVAWSVRAVVVPGGEEAGAPIVISPTRGEIDLYGAK